MKNARLVKPTLDDDHIVLGECQHALIKGKNKGKFCKKKCFEDKLFCKTHYLSKLEN